MNLALNLRFFGVDNQSFRILNHFQVFGVVISSFWSEMLRVWYHKASQLGSCDKNQQCVPKLNVVFRTFAFQGSLAGSK